MTLLVIRDCIISNKPTIMKKITLFLFLLSFVTINNIEAQITTFPYTEDFESGDGGWVANNNANGTWALGTPAGAIINSAASGTNSWVTNLSGNYNSNDDAWVTSPVFDFSSLTAPSIEMSIWYDIEFSWDGAVLQSSIDSGTSWQNVGAFGDPNNWYTDNTINGNPGGQQEGWSGTGTAGTNAWVIARHALTGLAGQSNVIFRIAFGSDGSVTDEGFGFDDINIFEVSCPEPTNTTITNILETSADVNWMAGGTETMWNLEWGVSGFTLGSGNLETGLTATMFNLTGLAEGTIYDVYILSDCGGIGTSTLVGPITFNTPAPGGTCAVAIPMTVETDCGAATPTSFDFSISEDIDAAGENPTCDGFGNFGYWLSFTAPAIGSVVFNFDGAADNVGLEVLDACGGTSLGCFNNDFDAGDNSGIIGGLTPGNTYVALIWTDTQSGTADVCIEEGPACPFPIDLDAINITEDSADLSWTENGIATTWNIEWGPTGFTQGTGTTINGVTNNPFNLTGLTQNTTYDFYVQADCGGGTSNFTGPFSFTTTPQTNFTLDCNAGPLTQDYCYDNGGATTPLIFNFTSNDGTPLNLNFNSGFVENNFDELVVLDSDGTPFPGFGPADNNYGNAGDISGLSFQSTGDNISFYINSDGSVSCTSGSANIDQGINYTVSCATCINPQATYAIIDDCDNGDQFLIDVDITSLGDATSLTISNNINTDTTPVTATGVYQIGPFPFLVDVIVTTSHDQDTNCVINSQPIQLIACPPDNDNPCDATLAVVNTDILCEVSTPGTIAAATPSGVPDPSCGSSADDDVWFQFVATNESHLISLANVTGSSATDMDHSVYSGTCDNLTEIVCIAGFADWSSVASSLTIGETYYIRVNSGGIDDEDTSFDLCITPYNTPTNIACDLAENFCSGSDASDILYSYNTINILPGDGAIDCLGSSPNPTYSVLEIGTSGDILIEMVQNSAFDANDNPIGDELDVDFLLWGPYAPGDDLCNLSSVVDCSFSAAPVENVTLLGAQQGEIYLLLITNFEGEAGVIQVRQTNVGETGSGSTIADIEAEITSQEVFIDPNNDPTEADEVSVCGFTSVTLETNSPFADTFTWYKNGFVIPGETSNSLTVTESDTYQVQAFDSQCNAEAFSQIVIVNLYNDPGTIAPQSLVVCDGPVADGTEDFDLDAFAASLGFGSDFTVSFYTNTDDANQAIDAVPSPYNSSGETLIIRIEDTNAATDGFLGCRQLSELELVVNARPTINQPMDFIVCDDIDGNVDGITDFNLTSIDGEISTDANVTISYHSSQEDADNDVSALPSPYSSDGETVFIRAEDNTTGCFATTSFNLVVNIVPLATFDPQYDYEVCPNATVPVVIGIVPTNFTEADVTINWFLDDSPIAGNSLTLDTVLVEGDYSAEITFNTSGCVNTITTFVTELENCIIPQAISPGVTDGQNDRFEASHLDVVKLEIFNRNGTLVYSKKNYTNEWFGQTNDGKELPVGTYFYTMIYEGGAKQRSSWIYVNR